MQQNAVRPPSGRADAAPAGPLTSPVADFDLRLDWIGAPGQTCCPLDAVWRDPSLTRGIAGVYLIWAATSGQSTVLYVGNSRDIGAMLSAQHDDLRIASHAWSGDLKISWAAVASVYRPGVTKYLVSTLLPQITESVPAARPVSVNLPL